MNNPSKLNSWKKIKNYSKAISKTSIHKMFRDDKNRFNNFSLELRRNKYQKKNKWFI